VLLERNHVGSMKRQKLKTTRNLHEVASIFEMLSANKMQRSVHKNVQLNYESSISIFINLQFIIFFFSLVILNSIHLQIHVEILILNTISQVNL